METIKLCGEEFTVSPLSYYLTLTKTEYICATTNSRFFNKIMGFTDADKRNEYIERQIGLRCKGASPEFSSRNSLNIFIHWFRNKYERDRIILTKNQIKNLL